MTKNKVKYIVSEYGIDEPYLESEYFFIHMSVHLIVVLVIKMKMLLTL